MPQAPDHQFMQSRENEREQARIADLMALLPARGATVLDIGARDGYLSLRLTSRFERVIALDLTRPRVEHPKITTVAADARSLPCADDSIDAVLCAEVLEHIPPPALQEVCREIVRVTRSVAVIGVPNRQDLRLGQTTCGHCGGLNPPWGHVNSFDEARLTRLFEGLRPTATRYVGSTRARTNALSCRLMRYAGNPYGTYEQEEACIHCAKQLPPPECRSFMQKLATRAGTVLTNLQQHLTRSRGNWLHMSFEKPAS